MWTGAYMNFENGTKMIAAKSRRENWSWFGEMIKRGRRKKSLITRIINSCEPVWNDFRQPVFERSKWIVINLEKWKLFCSACLPVSHRCGFFLNLLIVYFVGNARRRFKFCNNNLKRATRDAPLRSTIFTRIRSIYNFVRKICARIVSGWLRASGEN